MVSTSFSVFLSVLFASPWLPFAAKWKLKRSQKKAWNDPECARSGTCHFLLYFQGSQFCSSENVQCLEVFPDDQCHMSSGSTSGSFHTKMSSSGPSYDIVSGSDDCTCYNGVAGFSKPADDNEDVSGFSSSCQDGTKLVTGTWCEKTSLDPSYKCATGGKFTETIKTMCNYKYNFDVLGARMCNKVGFNLESRKVLKQVGPSDVKQAKFERAGARRGEVPGLLLVLAISLRLLQD